MPPATKRVVIIGAGPCGLGAAYRLEELRRSGWPNSSEWHVVDASANEGGLARTVVDENGFLWDMGGHVIFSHYTYFTELLTALVKEWNVLEREAWVWMRDTFIPYPFQQNIHRLPKEEVLQCIDGLIYNEKNRHKFNKPGNFYEWLDQSFGPGLCSVFMVPYNMKVWAYHPTKMNVEWMGERVATVDTSKVVKNVLEKKDELGWGPNATFRFPLHGGTGAIWTALYKALPQEKISFNKKVVHIDAQKKIITYSDKSTEQYDSLISSMPLDQLISVTHNLPGFTHEQLLEKAKEFRYSSSHIIGIGVDGQPPDSLKTKCWLYFPEDDCPFYRCTVFSNYSPYHVPKPHKQWSIMCEVSESKDKPVDLKNIVQQTVDGLINTKMITKDDKILTKFHTRLEYGYPTPFYGRDELCRPLFAALESCSIYSRGRFGAWKYEVSNQDHSMMQGVEAADAIVLGTDEPTFRTPGVVNAKTDKQGTRFPYIFFNEKQVQKQATDAQEMNGIH